MEDARNIDFHFQLLYWMKIKCTKTTRPSCRCQIQFGFDSVGDKHFVLIILHIFETTLQFIKKEIVVPANLH